MRRLKKIKHQKEKRKRIKFYISFLILAMLIAISSVAAAVFLMLKKIDSIIYVKVGRSGEPIYINIVDNKNNKFIKISIDSNLTVDSARNYGEYKLGNVWLLDQNEKLKGGLLTDTIIKNFYLPIHYYKSENRTNLPKLMNIFVTSFEKGIIRSEIVELNIKKVGRQPNEILVNFYDVELAENYKSIEVVDSTGSIDGAENFSEIIKSAGLKVGSYKRKEVVDKGCIFKFKMKTDEIISLAKSLGCEVEETNEVGSDLEVILGLQFSQRF